MSIPEVIHQMISLKLHSSSLSDVSVSLEGSSRVANDDFELKGEPSVLDNYAQRTNVLVPNIF